MQQSSTKGANIKQSDNTKYVRMECKSAHYTSAGAKWYKHLGKQFGII